MARIEALRLSFRTTDGQVAGFTLTRNGWLRHDQTRDFSLNPLVDAIYEQAESLIGFDQDDDEDGDDE